MVQGVDRAVDPTYIDLVVEAHCQNPNGQIAEIFKI